MKCDNAVIQYSSDSDMIKLFCGFGNYRTCSGSSVMKSEYLLKLISVPPLQPISLPDTRCSSSTRKLGLTRFISPPIQVNDSFSFKFVRMWEWMHLKWHKVWIFNIQHSIMKRTVSILPSIYIDIALIQCKRWDAGQGWIFVW